MHCFSTHQYFFQTIDERLPQEELITAKDLINAGLAVSSTTLIKWRKIGFGPASIMLSPGQLRYPKVAVLAWLKRLINFLCKKPSH